MRIRTLIADDEDLARAKLRRFLRDIPNVEVVAEACNGDEAIKALSQHHLDLLLLDVAMPGVDGLKVGGHAGECQVVFTTAYPEYAINAFELGDVADYVLKPYTRARLARAVEKVRRRIRMQGAHALMRDLLPALPAEAAVEGEHSTGERLLLRDARKVVMEETRDVLWVRAERNYVHIVCKRRRYFVRGTIDAVASAVPSFIVRIHRSFCVNLNHVRELSPRSHGAIAVTMSDGTQLKASRPHASTLLQAMRATGAHAFGERRR